MSTPRLPSPARAAVAALLAAGVLLGAGPAAAADAPPSPLGLTPSTGTDAAIVQLTTAGPCPAATTHVFAQLLGGALPAEGQVLRDTSRLGLSTTEPFTTEASRALRDVFLAAGQAPAVGQYVVELVCTDTSLSRLATFSAPLSFAADGTFSSPADAPQRTAATFAAGDGSSPVLDLGSDDASAPLTEDGATTGGPAGTAAGTQPDPQADPVPSGAAGISGATPGRAAGAADAGTSPAALVGVALLGAGLTASALLGVPALRRRRAGAPASAPPADDDRELAATGRTAP